MCEKTDNEIQKVQNILVNVEQLVNKVECDLEEMLEAVVKTGDLSDSSINNISVLSQKLNVIKEAGNSLYYKRKRLEKGSGLIPDEDLDDEGDEPDSMFYRALAKETKVRAIQFMYV